MKYYVYALIDPTRENRVFYIGKGTGRRAGAHLNAWRVGASSSQDTCADVRMVLEEEKNKADETSKLEYINRLEREGYGAQHIVRVVGRNLSEPLAFTLEAFLLKFAYGQGLTNRNRGAHHDRFRERGDWISLHFGAPGVAGQYVYVLRDPDSGEIIYVGKGSGDRFSQHFNEARGGRVDEALGREKTARLASLMAGGKTELEVARVIANSLTEEEAFAVEALTLKFIVGRSVTTNKVRGHHSWRFRAKNDWEPREGMDLPITCFPKGSRQIRAAELADALGEGLDEILERVTSQFPGEWTRAAIHGAGGVGRTRSLQDASGGNCCTLIAFVRSKGIQVEVRPLVGRPSRPGWISQQHDLMEYTARRRDGETFLPDLWTNCTTPDIDEAARRVDLMIQWAKSASLEDFRQRVGDADLAELLYVDEALRVKVEAKRRARTATHQARAAMLTTTTEELPRWLRDWDRGQPIRMADFFASPVVLYPGSGTDGQPVKFFGSRHAAHCFVFADYGIKKDHVLRELGEAGHPFLGYARAGRTNLSEQDLTPHGWVAHLHPEDAPRGPLDPEGPYAFIEVFERGSGFDDAHGPKRLVILFLCADGVAAYDALFCQAEARAPFAVVLQDHGFGGNWTRFGRGGSLERLASQTGRLPEFLLVAANTEAWAGYSAIDGTVAGGGGMHGFDRQLWRRSELTSLG